MTTTLKGLEAVLDLPVAYSQGFAQIRLVSPPAPDANRSAARTDDSIPLPIAPRDPDEAS
jgi:hypothetical protein